MAPAPEKKPEPTTLSEAQKQTAPKPEPAKEQQPTVTEEASQEKKPEPTTRDIPVVATKPGFYGRHMEKGRPFSIARKADFSKRWMRPANAAAAEALGVEWKGTSKPAAECGSSAASGQRKAKPTGEQTVI